MIHMSLLQPWTKSPLANNSLVARQRIRAHYSRSFQQPIQNYTADQYGIVKAIVRDKHDLRSYSYLDIASPHLSWVPMIGLIHLDNRQTSYSTCKVQVYNVIIESSPCMK
jgi:hypothetical protein